MAGMLGQRRSERPLDDVTGHGAAVVEGRGHGGAALDRAGDARAVGERERELAELRVPRRHDLHEPWVAHRERDLPVRLAQHERAIAGRACDTHVDRVHGHQPTPLDRREREGRDDRHVSGAAAASGP